MAVDDHVITGAAFVALGLVMLGVAVLGGVSSGAAGGRVMYALLGGVTVVSGVYWTRRGP